jgi:hypothetical protein
MLWKPIFRRRVAFTLVEVTLVIAIIGVLGMVALQAVQASRESARQLSCRNNLRQIGLGTSQFLGVRQHYPTGGWGWKWVADAPAHPKYGQPGGWLYQLLPYLEASLIYDIPRGNFSSRREAETEIHRLLATPHPIFHCPSRPIKRVIPFNIERIPVVTNLTATPDSVALTDYAANGGTRGFIRPSADGPISPSSYAIESHSWATLNQGDGVLLLHHRFTPAHIRTGTSNVLWVGEKYVGHANYEVDHLGGNDQSLYSGECTDIRRYVRSGIIPDRHPIGDYQSFGTPHSGMSR